MAAKPIPDGYHSVQPYLALNGAAQGIEFYKDVFGAEELMRMPGPDGTVGHAELRVGDSIIMLADESAEIEFRSPDDLGGSSVTILLYVDDCDAVFRRAVEAGATGEREPADQFYGDRASTIRDPFGHRWFIHTSVEDVSPEEMERRVQALDDAG